MTFHTVLMWGITLGAVTGGLDYLAGNRLGLGDKFVEGLRAMAPLALSMTGILCLAPVLAKVLAPVLTSLFDQIGADPAMFAALIGNDMGGYPLAMSLARDPQVGRMAGLITASMLGCTLVFSIPVGLGIIPREDRPWFARGLLIGLATVPVGSVVGGLLAGFAPGMVLLNHVPILLFAVLIVLGLRFAPQKMVAGAVIFGKFITALSVLGCLAAMAAHFTGVALLEGMEDIGKALAVVADVALVLAGVFPVLELLLRALKRPLAAAGDKMGVDAVSMGGLLVTLVNSVPVYGMFKDMRQRGKVLNTAWLVPATAAFGDHLGFTVGADPAMVAPMILGKLTAGSVALLLACVLTRDLKEPAVEAA